MAESRKLIGNVRVAAFCADKLRVTAIRTSRVINGSCIIVLTSCLCGSRSGLRSRYRRGSGGRLRRCSRSRGRCRSRSRLRGRNRGRRRSHSGSRNCSGRRRRDRRRCRRRGRSRGCPSGRLRDGNSGALRRNHAAVFVSEKRHGIPAVHLEGNLLYPEVFLIAVLADEPGERRVDVFGIPHHFSAVIGRNESPFDAFRSNGTCHEHGAVTHSNRFSAGMLGDVNKLRRMNVDQARRLRRGRRLRRRFRSRLRRGIRGRFRLLGRPGSGVRLIRTICDSRLCIDSVGSGRYNSVGRRRSCRNRPSDSCFLKSAAAKRSGQAEHKHQRNDFYESIHAFLPSFSSNSISHAVDRVYPCFAYSSRKTGAEMPRCGNRNYITMSSAPGLAVRRIVRSGKSCQSFSENNSTNGWHCFPDRQKRKAAVLQVLCPAGQRPFLAWSGDGGINLIEKTDLKSHAGAVRIRQIWLLIPSLVYLISRPTRYTGKAPSPPGRRLFLSENTHFGGPSPLPFLFPIHDQGSCSHHTQSPFRVSNEG